MSRLSADTRRAVPVIRLSAARLSRRKARDLLHAVLFAAGLAMGAAAILIIQEMAHLDRMIELAERV